jgi:putative endonuclease
MASAIHREKRLKTWLRKWKIALIEESNADWRDLHEEIDAVATLVDEYVPLE